MLVNSNFEKITHGQAVKRAMLISIFVIGLIYILLPIPQSISDFPPLLNSAESDLPGDTWQNPNIVGYYSDFRRDDITKFYRNFFSKSSLFGFIPLPIAILNHPPEEAYRYVRDQQESTFLEEYTIPLKGSIFVNGYEPKVENDMRKNRDRSFVGDHVYFQEIPYNSKTTLKYYPTNFFSRLLIYFGIWLSSLLLYKVYKKLSFEA